MPGAFGAAWLVGVVEEVVADGAVVFFVAVVVAGGLEDEGGDGEDCEGVEDGVDDEAGEDWFVGEDAAAVAGFGGIGEGTEVDTVSDFHRVFGSLLAFHGDVKGA